MLIKQGKCQMQKTRLPHSTAPCPNQVMSNARLGIDKYNNLLNDDIRIEVGFSLLNKQAVF